MTTTGYHRNNSRIPKRTVSVVLDADVRDFFRAKSISGKVTFSALINGAARETMHKIQQEKQNGIIQ